MYDAIDTDMHYSNLRTAEQWDGSAISGPQLARTLSPPPQVILPPTKPLAVSYMPGMGALSLTW